MDGQMKAREKRIFPRFRRGTSLATRTIARASPRAFQRAAPRLKQPRGKGQCQFSVPMTSPRNGRRLRAQAIIGLARKVKDLDDELQCEPAFISKFFAGGGGGDGGAGGGAGGRGGAGGGAGGLGGGAGAMAGLAAAEIGD